MADARRPSTAVTERAALDRKARGNLAEAAARDALVRAGLREVAANANYRGGELDLVMLEGGGRDGPVLVFVEVRYRQSGAFGGGAASVDIGKRRKLVYAAQSFLGQHRQYSDFPCRFDVVEADGDPQAPRINWLRDAFRADDI
ncbi:MAG: YraN family protein [Pseudoxanthomonas sp.]